MVKAWPSTVPSRAEENLPTVVRVAVIGSSIRRVQLVAVQAPVCDHARRLVASTASGVAMGTWDVGPFDNDAAADWCGDLNDAEPHQRVAIVRSALNAVLGNGDEYLDIDLAVEAIAAAAVIASQLPGATAVTSPYGPDFLLEGGRLEVPDELRALATRALDRIVGDNSEWRDLWEESDSYEAARAELRRLRTDLGPGSSNP